MSSLAHAMSFRDLLVYQKARAVSRRIFQMSKQFPRDERYSLTDQIRRSSRSVGAQITEAWAKRRYQNHFVSKLTDADAEQQETQHWLETALECEYVDAEEVRTLLTQLDEIGRMLHSMMTKASQFCGSPSNAVRESIAEYLVNQ